MSKKVIKPQYQKLHAWENYASYLMTEYQQSIEEGLDIEAYKDVFEAASKLPVGETANKIADALFEVVLNAPLRADYKYNEPTDLEGIRALRKPYAFTPQDNGVSLEDKVHGAWLGRICGCMLGKTVECVRTNVLVPYLKDTNNYPMFRYTLFSDLTDELKVKYRGFETKIFADQIDGMPVDDDTNYMLLYQLLIEKFGRNFTPDDVAEFWLEIQCKDAYCTAERIAFRNYVNGIYPPDSAIYKNPYREWLGAQIRADYFGYINPGDPETASEMDWRDGITTHTKNGVYGGMLISAMLAIAAVTDNIEDIILGGLAYIPHTSRLYEEVMKVYNGYKNGVSHQECFDDIHARYNEYVEHGWCHTVANAMIVVAALLYGGGDYGRSICMAVETGFDTDCNGATIGSVLGMALGKDCISEAWYAPINNTLHTSLMGLDTVKISDRVAITLKHIENK